MLQMPGVFVTFWRVKMQLNVNKPEIGFKDIPSFVWISIFRRLEQLLPPQKLLGLVRALCFLRAWLHSAFKKVRIGPPVPEMLRFPRSRRTNIEHRTSLYLDNILLNFPDRLASPKWLERFRIEGLAPLEEALRAGRPVVLAYWHFGSFPVAHCWLRGALKFPVGGLIGGKSFWRTRLSRLQDNFLPLPEVPDAIYLDQLRDLTEFIAAGHFIYIAIDAPTGKQMVVPFCEGWDIQMATGAIRLASRFEAEIIPCTITHDGAWRYCITLGRPAPKEWLADEANWPQVGKHLLGEMMPVFHAHPDLCWEAMTGRLIPKPAKQQIAHKRSSNVN